MAIMGVVNKSLEVGSDIDIGSGLPSDDGQLLFAMKSPTAEGN